MNKFMFIIILEFVIWIVTTIAICVAIETTQSAKCLVAYVIPLISLLVFNKEGLYDD